MAELNEEQVSVWKKRIRTAKDVKKKYYEINRIETGYLYWRGAQRAHPLDEFEDRRAQVNKIHPEVSQNIPSLYFYRPYARLVGEPEQVDDPGTTVEDDLQMLQDSANHIIRDKRTCFRPSTYLALKEAHWAFGVVEVGYSAEFIDDPTAAGKPALKEKPDTKIASETGYSDKSAPSEVPAEPISVNSDTDDAEPATGGGEAESSELEAAPPVDELKELQAELERLQGLQRSEEFFVKYIPARQVLISPSDKPVLEQNDWIGYWEDVPLEDVKRCKAYKNVGKLTANASADRAEEAERKSNENYADKTGTIPSVTLYKIWDLRTRQKYVFAEGGDLELMCKPFKRTGGLKCLRFDVDPYHFYPRSPLLSKLDIQDEYNDSREYLRKVRKGTVPRYTYNKQVVDAHQMKKLESGDMGTYIPVDGSEQPVQPIQQPSYSENAMQTLTLSDKEFSDVGGVGGDSRIAQSKTATQAKIGETKMQAQDSFDRTIVADWLAEIIEELIWLMIDHMTVERWIGINVVPDGQAVQELTPIVAEQYQRISGEILQRAAAGVRWTVTIDVDSLSPVSEEQKFQKWMQGLAMLSNPPMARLFAVAPPILMETLKLLGIKGAKQQQMIADGMRALMQLEQQLAAQSQNSAPGMPSQPKAQPNQPQPQGPQAPPGPPQR